MEAERPWLLERRATAEDTIHSWAHTLISFPRLPASTEAVISVEKQLLTLQAKVDEQALERKRADEQFEKFAAEMRDRMQILEGLLTRIAQGN